MQVFKINKFEWKIMIKRNAKITIEAKNPLCCIFFLANSIMAKFFF
jgi:hypothetical protein